jgi:predicted ATPase
VQGLAEARVPDTIQDIIMARLDRLGEEGKRTVQLASVIGRQFLVRLLDRIADVTGPLEGLLTELQTLELIYRQGLLPEPAYVFKHAMIQEVAYNSLLVQRRKAVHQAVGDAIEELYRDRLEEHAEELAHHFSQGEVWEKAVTHGRQAGNKASERGAFREAVTGYERALHALQHRPDTPDTGVTTIELYNRLGAMLSVLGEHKRSLALLGEAEARARQLDDRARLGWVLSRMVTVRRIVGDLDGAMAAGRQALELAATLGDPALRMDASYRLGQAYLGRGDFSRAAELLRWNVAAVERGISTPVRHSGVFPPAWLAIVSRAWLAQVLSELGEFAEGRHHGEEALRLAMVGAQRDAPTTAHQCLGNLYLTQGDLEAAVRVLDRGLGLCRASGHRASSSAIAGSLGEAYGRVGRLAEGLALLEEARRDDLRTGALVRQTTHARQLSAVYLFAGRLDEAWQHACQALDLARQQQARGNEALALFQLAAAHAHATPPTSSRSRRDTWRR